MLILHVVLSLVGIVAGIAWLYQTLGGQSSPGLTLAFLALNILTDVTGFPLPPFGLDPPRIVGVLSLLLLALACLALYAFGLKGLWRPIFVAAGVAALWLNVFVAVAQAFQKLPPLHSLAPTPADPPFLIAQAAVLAAFVALGALAVARVRRAPQFGT